MAQNERATKITYEIRKILFIIFTCRKQCAHLQHFLRRSTWITNVTLYTVELEISRAFQPYIGLYAFDFFFWVKTSRHRGIYFGRKYFVVHTRRF